MNKTISVNLSGNVFILEDDAYEMLQNYLRELSAHFANEQGCAEIIEDIETRIAEHFRTEIKVERQVICVSQVSKVIEIMGRPGQIDDEVEPENTTSNKRTYRHMYRDVDDRIVGGVCSGMGYYFKLEPLLFRIIFIITSFLGGLGIILYAILWLVVPQAQTKAQKLEMRGEPVTAENIGKEFDNSK